MFSVKKKKEMHQEMGKFLYEKRIKAGLSQKDVSDKLGYTSPQFISNYERGLCSPPLKKLKKIAELYKIKPKVIADLMIKYSTEAIYHEMDIKKKA